MRLKDKDEEVRHLSEKLNRQQYDTGVLKRENSFLRTELQRIKQKERETSEYAQYLQHELLRVKCELEECKNGR